MSTFLCSPVAGRINVDPGRSRLRGDWGSQLRATTPLRRLDIWWKHVIQRTNLLRNDLQHWHCLFSVWRAGYVIGWNLKDFFSQLCDGRDVALTQWPPKPHVSMKACTSRHRQWKNVHASHNRWLLDGRAFNNSLIATCILEPRFLCSTFHNLPFKSSRWSSRY